MYSVAEVIWKDVEEKEEQAVLIEKVLQKCFEVEHINPTSLYICVTLTNPENIKEINKQYRNIDRSTDVLSFPMFEKEELDDIVSHNALIENKEDTEKEIDEKDLLGDMIMQDIMGDIIISLEKVEEQAKEYGHSFEREFAYMLVHGFYHLRGYDHMTEDEKKEMREKEENVLSKLNITRDI